MPEANLRAIENFVARLDVVPFEEQATKHFGQIKTELSQAEMPIEAYDTMIAGHARAPGLILVTNNLREFQRVEGLRLENWVLS